MTYSIMQPPFTLKFREMTKKELKDYLAWFLSVIPERVDELSRTVRQTPGYEVWQPNFTPSSLDDLGKWFATQVETRPRTLEDIQEIEAGNPYPIEIPREELTNRTFSLAMDIGVYLSQVFLKQHPGLRWDQPFGSKRFVDYGQPVLVDFTTAPFNPVRMLVTYAYGLAGHTGNSRELRELYDNWSKLIRG